MYIASLYRLKLKKILPFINDAPKCSNLCAVPEKIHTLPTEGIGISLREGGSLRQQI